MIASVYLTQEAAGAALRIGVPWLFYKEDLLNILRGNFAGTLPEEVAMQLAAGLSAEVPREVFRVEVVARPLYCVPQVVEVLPQDHVRFCTGCGAPCPCQCVRREVGP